jgi:hypothetical protein
VRAALKKKFPGVKFSVRSETYAGGASIRVGWTDGPTNPMVEAIAKQYAGGDFDGSIDLKITGKSWLLPDGSATPASFPGTTGSMGTIPPIREWMPDPAAKLVRFGADYVFCNRSYSAAFLRRRMERLGERYGVDLSTARIRDGVNGAYIENGREIQVFKVPGVPGEGWLDTELYRAATKVAADFQ